MTNGENTAFVPIREFFMSRRFPGYIGYNSDSEVFTHILHYTVQAAWVFRSLIIKMYYASESIRDRDKRRQRSSEAHEAVLRPLCIDGPNVVIGFTPDGTCFMVQDAKKLRPGVVGGVKGKYALMSEECGLDSAIPKRDRVKDIFPMKYDMVIVSRRHRR